MRWIAIVAAALAMVAYAPALAQGRAGGLRGDPGLAFGPDAYPVEAIRAGEEGRVVAKLWIDPYGKVSSCTVTGSSGSPSLDRRTCEIALEKVSFTPATDRRGRPIAASYTLPVRWVLPREAVDVGSLPADESVEVTVSVDSAGEVIACNVKAMPPGRARFDLCENFPVGKKDTSFAWTRDGKPVGGTIVRTMRQRIVLDP